MNGLEMKENWMTVERRERERCAICIEDILQMKSAKRSENIDSCAKKTPRHTYVWHSMLFSLIVFVPFLMRLWLNHSLWDSSDKNSHSISHLKWWRKHSPHCRTLSEFKNRTMMKTMSHLKENYPRIIFSIKIHPLFWVNWAIFEQNNKDEEIVIKPSPSSLAALLRFA